MLLHIPDVLTAGQVAEAGQRFEHADWSDGRVTAGHQSAAYEGQHAAARKYSGRARAGRHDSRRARASNPLFISAALPLKVFPPLFNRYQGGGVWHAFDDAIRK